MIAEQLCNQLDIRCLAAACACAGELKQRLLELRALNRCRLEVLDNLILYRKLDAIVECSLLVRKLLCIFLECHCQSRVLYVAGAYIRAGTAACAVERGYNDGKLITGHTCQILCKGSFRKLCCLFLCHCNRTDCSVRAYIGAESTLDTCGSIPNRYVNRDAALLECGCAGRCGAVSIRKNIGNLQACCNLMEFKAFINAVCPGSGNFYLVPVLGAGINSLPVLLNDILTLAAVCLLSCVLHQLDRLIFRNDLCDAEECGLQNGVDSCRSHACLDTKLYAIDRIQVDLVIINELLNLAGKFLLEIFIGPVAVQQEAAAVNQLLNHVEHADVFLLVACNKVRLMNQVGGLNRLLTKTKVGHCYAAGLLGVIIEVCLCVHIRIVADDLNGVLVRAYSTVSAKAPELAAYGSFRSCNNFLAGRKGKICYIIGDADRESLLFGVVINRDDLCGCCILGTKTVTAAENFDILELGILESCNNIKEQRLADGAGLLCSVKNGDLLNSIRNRVNQSFRAERSVQVNFNDTDLAPCSVQIINCLFDRLVYRAHRDDDLLCIRSAVVVEQAVVCADLLVDLLHVLLDNGGHCVVVLVAGFTCCEEDIRVLSGTHLTGMVGIQSVVTELLNLLEIDEILEIFVIPNLNLLNFVRCAETVEEVDERKLSVYCSAVSNGCQIHNFLNGAGAEHCGTGLTACINVGVIAEDVQSVCSYAAGRYVEYCRKAFTCDLVDVRDHQKKSLRSCEGGCHGTGNDGAVCGTRSAGFRLHLGYVYNITENVLTSGSSPLINMLRHN